MLRGLDVEVPPVCFLIVLKVQLVPGCGGARLDSPIIGREIPFSRLSPHPLDYHPGAVTFVSCWEVAARAVTPLAISCDLRIPWIDNL